MNNEVMFSSKSEIWETPQDFFDALDAEFGFDIDVCALPENAKCERYYTPDDDGLSQPWQGTVWCNPPYGREVSKWIAKASESASGGQRSSCYCPSGQTRNGFTNTFTTRQKSDSFPGG